MLMTRAWQKLYTMKKHTGCHKGKLDHFRVLLPGVALAGVIDAGTCLGVRHIRGHGHHIAEEMSTAALILITAQLACC
eukprot:5691873-Amphidinium_carterae.2